MKPLAVFFLCCGLLIAKSASTTETSTEQQVRQDVQQAPNPDYDPQHSATLPVVHTESVLIDSIVGTSAKVDGHSFSELKNAYDLVNTQLDEELDEPPPSPTFSDTDNAYAMRFGVVVDCGSSGSRANLYQWAINEQNEVMGLVRAMVDEKNKPLSKKISPGLSEIDTEKPEKILEYITPLLDYVRNSIPEKELGNTDIFFLATAGMRPLGNTKVYDTMNPIIDVVNQMRLFNRVQARVITGKEEALFEWYSVKMLTENFLKPNFGYKRGGTGEVDGIIEMGGASLQVAFGMDAELREEIESRIDVSAHEIWKPWRLPQIPKEFKNTLEIFGLSFLGLGSNSVRQLVLEQQFHGELKSFVAELTRIENGDTSDEKLVQLVELLQTKDQLPTVADPCTPSGYRYTKQARKEIVINDYFLKYYREPDTVPKAKEDEIITIKVKGAGNPEDCAELLHDFIDKYRSDKLFCKNRQVCPNDLLRTRFTPFDEIKFIALGNFYYPMELIGSDGKLSYIDAYNFATNICRKTKEELEQKYPNANDFDKERLQNQCFNSLWGLTFLEYGLRLMPHESDSVTVVKAINEKSIDWTLGAITSYAVLQSNNR